MTERQKRTCTFICIGLILQMFLIVYALSDFLWGVIAALALFMYLVVVGARMEDRAAREGE